MKKGIAVCGMMALFLSCGNDEELLKIKRDIAKVQEQIYELERQQAQIKAETASQLKGLDRKLDDRTDVADVQDQLHRIKQQMSEYDALVRDLDGKIADLKVSSARVSLAPENPAVAAESAAEPPTGVTGTSAPVATPPTETTEVSGDVLQNQFRQGYLDYNRGKYDVAIEAFRGILANYPNSPVTEKAMYYLGHSLYQKEKYEEALNLFEQIVKNYPNGPFLKPAMYYTGRCSFSLGQASKAVMALRALIQSHPDSQEAELAANFLKSAGFER